jgi:hypothetical protein
MMGVGGIVPATGHGRLLHGGRVMKADAILLWAVCLALLAGPSFAASAAAGESQITPAEKKLLVWHFDQCSYNALGSVLTYYYGPGPTIDQANRSAFERKTFVRAINATGYGGFFGWAPWTSKMVDSGLMVWNGHRVNNLVAENFSLATKKVPQVLVQFDRQSHRYQFWAVVRFMPGERAQLIARLKTMLAKGPVIIWTPYAAMLDRTHPNLAWHRAKRKSPGHYMVPFNPYLTHAVAVFAIKHSQRVLVVDGSMLNGVYKTTPNNVVCTAAAMSASVRLKWGGPTILSSCGDMQGDRFDVVFYRPKHGLRAESLVPAWHRARVLTAVDQAGANRANLLAGYKRLPKQERPALSFLLANMPLHDRQTLSGTFLANDVALAYKAVRDRPWHSHIPQQVFMQYVLPYANLDEKRDNWRQQLWPICRRLVAGCHSASAAALAINKQLFHLLNVSYNARKRPIPNESPTQSMASHYDSCSGLSILLCDACRSVGVPARVVGTPMWAMPPNDPNGDNAGNHTWVEIWDGQWHVMGSDEVSPLDKHWFLPMAARAYPSRHVMIDGIYAHRVYAACFRRKALTPGNWWPMVWNLADRSVYADDVSADYYHRELVKVRISGTGTARPAKLVLHRDGQLIADLPVHGSTMLWLSAGGHYKAAVTCGGKSWTADVTVPARAPFVIRIQRP